MRCVHNRSIEAKRTSLSRRPMVQPRTSDKNSSSVALFLRTLPGLR